MKIEDIRVLPTNLEQSLVEVISETGLTGIGITQAPSIIIRSIVETPKWGLRDLLLGLDPQDTNMIWSRMFRVWQAQRGRGAEGGLAVNAMAAIDMALWDLLGKIRGLPIHQLMGGKIRDELKAYASASAFHRGPDGWNLKSADELAVEASNLAKQGFKAVKYGWGAHFGPEDENRLKALREGLGPGVQMMIDIGCPAYWIPGWDAKAAIQAVKVVQKFKPYFVEEVLPPLDVRGHKQVSRSVNTRIATGESLTTVDQFQPYIENRAVNILQPDAAQMGITQMVEVVRCTNQFGLLTIPHSPWSAPVVAAHVHILSTVNNGPMIEYPALECLGSRQLSERTRIMQNDIIQVPLDLEDGYITVPDEPGLGLGNYQHEVIKQLEGQFEKSAR